MWKSIWTVLKQLKIKLPYDQVVSLLIPNQKLQTLPDRFLHIRVYCFFIHYSKELTQPREEFTKEWIIKIWGVYKIKYYSFLNKNKTRKVCRKGKDLICIKLTEATQPQKIKAARSFSYAESRQQYILYVNKCIYENRLTGRRKRW